MMNHGWGLFVFCWSLLFYPECVAVDRWPRAGNSHSCWGGGGVGSTGVLRVLGAAQGLGDQPCTLCIHP